MALFQLLPLLATAAIATAPNDLTAASVATLVNAHDTAAIVEPLRLAVASSDPLVRATAARVATVREIRDAIATLRDQLSRETDAAAAREEIRAIASLGNSDDIDFALATAAKWPSSVDADLAMAIARRGGPEAVDIYVSKLRSLRRIDRGQFFRTALWGRPALATLAASRILGVGDSAGWRFLLLECRNAKVAIDPGILTAALNSPSDDIRTETVWHVVRVFASDAAQLPALLRERLTATGVTSNQEAFGRELVGRMLGNERKDDERWIAWLESNEADPILGEEKNPAVYSLLTDREFAARRQHCGMLPVECATPPKKPVMAATVIPAQPVAPPEFSVPTDLPAGLVSQLLTCDDGWIGTAAVTISPRGLVESLDLGTTTAQRCTKALQTILRLSLPANASMTSPHASQNVVLARAAHAPLCLDEPPPSEAMTTGVMPPGGKVVAPKVKHRVEPQFPARARRAMGSNKALSLTLQSTITRSGCVRDVRVLSQTPYPEVNSAAVLAMSQWTFYPGTMDGESVDVVFSLTLSFRSFTSY